MFVCADVRRLQKATDWQPRYDIESGLRQTVGWWRENLNVNP
jgi:nucleoside-diphosphate-sugar epimerase